MLSDSSHHVLVPGDPAPAVDRGMLVLQYAMAAIAAIAAIVLGVIR